MKVLITGSHGFVGTNLIEALSGEHEILRWDVRSDEKLPECDAVIHLAGKAHDTRSFDRLRNLQQKEYFEVNTELTKKIYDAFLKSKASKFIFFSSIKAQDNDTPYARSKKAAEDYILSHTDITESTDSKTNTNCTNDTNGISRHARDDNASTGSATKRIYILRPCMIHGKGVKGNLPLLFKFVKKGLPWPLAAFDNQRSYASMGNVSYIVNELLKKNVKSGTYNVCDDETVSTNELIELMSKEIGRKTKMIKIPMGIVRMGAKIGDLIHLSLNTERLGKLTESNVIDNSEIKKALSISYMPVKAMDGLKFTINGMISND